MPCTSYFLICKYTHNMCLYQAKDKIRRNAGWAVSNDIMEAYLPVTTELLMWCYKNWFLEKHFLKYEEGLKSPKSVELTARKPYRLASKKQKTPNNSQGVWKSGSGLLFLGDRHVTGDDQSHHSLSPVEDRSKGSMQTWWDQAYRQMGCACISFFLAPQAGRCLRHLSSLIKPWVNSDFRVLHAEHADCHFLTSEGTDSFRSVSSTSFV